MERYVRPILGTSRDIIGEYWYVPLPFLVLVGRRRKNLVGRNVYAPAADSTDPFLLIPEAHDAKYRQGTIMGFSP